MDWRIGVTVLAALTLTVSVVALVVQWVVARQRRATSAVPRSLDEHRARQAEREAHFKLARESLIRSVNADQQREAARRRARMGGAEI